MLGFERKTLIKSWISRGLNPHGLLSEDTNIDTSINQACVATSVVNDEL